MDPRKSGRVLPRTVAASFDPGLDMLPLITSTWLRRNYPGNDKDSPKGPQ
jgi:hypothetical protein